MRCLLSVLVCFGVGLAFADEPSLPRSVPEVVDADAAGADPTHYAVKIIDTAGNLIQRIGCHGNAETVPGPDGNAKDLGFRIIQNVAAVGDDLYVVDRGLRRVAKVTMAYRESRSAEVEGQ